MRKEIDWDDIGNTQRVREIYSMRQVRLPSNTSLIVFDAGRNFQLHHDVSKLRNLVEQHLSIWALCFGLQCVKLVKIQICIVVILKLIQLQSDTDSGTFTTRKFRIIVHSTFRWMQLSRVGHLTTFSDNAIPMNPPTSLGYYKHGIERKTRKHIISLPIRI